MKVQEISHYNTSKQRRSEMVMGHDQLSNHDMTITGEEHINSNGTNMVRLQRALCPNLYSAQRRRTQ